MTLSTPKTFNYKKLLFLSLAFNLLLTVILLSRTCSRRPETEKVYSQDLYKGGSNTFTNTVSNKHTAAAAGNKLTAYLRRHGSAPALIKKLATDNQLQLYKYNSAHFQNSRLFAMLEGAPKMDVYLILEYNASLNYKELSLLNKRNLDSKLQAKTEYLHKRWGIYYCRYEALADIKDLTFLKNIYIINRFTARGYYNIAFRPEQASENFHVSLMLPYSKPGKELVSMQPHIRGIFKLIAKEYNGNKLKLELRTKGYPIVLFCELAYHVD
ncbi:MAG TPA: hypothetical protein VKS21_01740, partial [Spirochaetota bacterium]|nr:hypothetical protein [Spirochaetota bacterium]